MSWLSDRLKEAAAQVNPFDGGKTAATVRAQRPAPPPAQTVRNTVTNNPVTRGFSRAVDQANPFDNGRTWKQRTAIKPPRSVFDQARNNGLTNVVGGVAKPLIRGGIALNQGLANAQLKAAGQPTLNAEEFTRQSYPDALNRMVGYTGTKRQIAGDAISNVVNVAAPGSSKLLEAGVKTVAPKVAKTIVPKVISNAVVGAPVGAIGNVGSLVSDDNTKLTRQNVTSAAKTGAAFGAVGGAALPVAGAAVRVAKPVVKAGAAKTVKAAQTADQKVFTPRTNLDDQYTLRDASDYLAGNSNMRPSEISATLARARDIAAQRGINIARGSRAEQLAAVNTILDQVGRQSKKVSQGGYAMIRKQEPAPVATAPAAPPQAPPRNRVAAAAEPQPQLPAPRTQAQLATGGDNITNAPPSVMAGNAPRVTKQTRYASKTVPESEFVSDQVKKDVKAGAPVYDVQTEKARYTDSLSRLKAQGDDAFELDVRGRLEAPDGKIGSQDVADAQTLAAILDAKGDTASLQKATDLYERLSTHLTAAGQTVQAAAILSRRTPQGLSYWATKQLKQAGVPVTPQLQTQLKQLVDATKNAQNKERAVYNVTKLVSDNIPSSAGDRIINFWRAGLLTAPTTTGGNLLGNTGETLVRKGFVNPVATAVDAGIGMFTGKRTQTLAPFGSATRGGIEGSKKLPDFIKTGYDERNSLSKYDTQDINYGNSPAGKAVGAYVNGVYRLMSVADQPYWYAARNEALGSIAKSEAINRGLRGTQQSAFVQQFMKNPPTDAIERATAEAMYATFQNKTTLGNVASSLKRGAGKAKPVADFFIPFTQVPASIATRIVERTPVGIASNVIKQVLNVRKGGEFDQRALSQAIANGSFGPAMFAVGYSLANSGLLTFGFPEDPKERELWEAEGKQPYSVKVGNRWYSLNYVQPFGTLLAIGGQAKQAVNEGASTADVISQGIATAGQSVMNQSFLKGVSGVLDALDDPKRNAQDWLENTASSVIPNFVRSGTRAADPLQRDVNGFKEGIQSAIPGLRDNLPAKQDMAGNDLAAKDNFLNQFVNPLKPSIAKDSDPTTQELRRLQNLDAGVIPSKIQKDSLGKDTELNKDQIRELQSNVGKSVNKAWQDLMATDQYKKLSDTDKAKALKDLSTDVLAVEKQSYAAKNQLGQYSSTYTGEKTSLTKSQTAIVNGNLDTTTYAKGETSNKVDIKGDDRGTSLLDKVGTMSKDQLKEWKSKEFDSSYQDLYERANKQIRPEGLTDLPKNNKTLEAYAKYLEIKSANPSKLKLNDAKKDFLKDSYKSLLNDNAQELFGEYTNAEKMAAIASKDISQEDFDLALQYDNFLLNTGLASTAKISNTIRREFGKADAPKAKGGGSTGGSSGGSRSGSKKRGGKARTSYKLPSYASTLSTERSLRQMLKRATL